MSHKKIYISIVKKWLNENRPDIDTDESTLESIYNELKGDVTDLEVSTAKMFITEYLSQNYNFELKEIIESVMQEIYPKNTVDFKNFGIYNEEIATLMEKVAEARIGENFSIVDESIVYDDNVREEILKIVRTYGDENYESE